MKHGLFRELRLPLLSGCCVFFGILQVVYFYVMAKKMSGYPIFLLYFTTVIYTISFLAISIVRVLLDKHRTDSLYSIILAPKYHYQFIVLSVATSMNGILSQFADGFVSGGIQNVLYQLQLPATAIFAYCRLGEKLDRYAFLGSALVIFGCLLSTLPPLIQLSSVDMHLIEYSNQSAPPSISGLNDTQLGPVSPLHAPGASGYTEVEIQEVINVEATDIHPIWVLAFAVSILPNAFCAVFQEEMFQADPSLDVGIILFWTNFYTLIWYLTSFPLAMGLYHLSWEGIVARQGKAFECFFQTIGMYDDTCEQNAFIAVLLFTIGYLGFFYFLAELVKEVNAVFASLVSSIVTPTSAIVFSFSWLLGDDAEELTRWVIAASVIVPLGVVVAKFPAIKLFLKENGQEDETQEVCVGSDRLPSSGSSLEESKIPLLSEKETS